MVLDFLVKENLMKNNFKKLKDCSFEKGKNTFNKR